MNYKSQDFDTKTDEQSTYSSILRNSSPSQVEKFILSEQETVKSPEEAENYTGFSDDMEFKVRKNHISIFIAGICVCFAAVRYTVGSQIYPLFAAKLNWDTP